MALDHDRDFIDIAEETEARQALHRVSFIGITVSFLLGFGLIALLIYGRILIDSNVVELTAPATVTVPQATPTPSARYPTDKEAFHDAVAR